VGLLQEHLAEARQQAAAAAAVAAEAAHAAQAAEPASGSGCVTLVLNVSEPAPAPAAEPAESAPAMQLLLNIVDAPPAAEQRDAGEGSGAAPADAAALQQQLQRVEACREELARQAGQLKGRIAKVGWRGCTGAQQSAAGLCLQPILRSRLSHAHTYTHPSSSAAAPLLPPPSMPAFLPAAGGCCAGGREQGQGSGSRA
jgi:hypothetical protein